MNNPPTTMQHSTLVRNLCKDGEEIHNDLSYTDCHLLHMVLGISGEAGEILDAVKKACIYRKSLDVANVIEELGDLEFYIEGLRQAVGVTREQVLDHNIQKLTARYGDKYSDQAAVARKDKQT